MGGTEKAMVHLCSYRTYDHMGQICNVQQFGDLYDLMQHTFTKATWFTCLLSPELREDYEKQFQAALSTPLYLVRESVTNGAISASKDLYISMHNLH